MVYSIQRRRTYRKKSSQSNRKVRLHDWIKAHIDGERTALENADREIPQASLEAHQALHELLENNADLYSV